MDVVVIILLLWLVGMCRGGGRWSRDRGYQPRPCRDGAPVVPPPPPRPRVRRK